MTTTDTNSSALLTVKNLVATFPSPDGPVRVVDDVSFELRRGQILGIVGESGSGKTVTSRAMLRMIPAPGRVESGSIVLQGHEIGSASESEMRRIRGKEIAMIFQDPQATLNPVVRIKTQIEEALRIHGVGGAEAMRRMYELLEQVGIPNPVKAANKYPHEFSGGMRQRVVIAIALANKPSVLVADEPTTALDVTIQAQILDLIRDLRDELKIGILLITHDMGVVAELCDDVLVMYKGQVVERGPVSEVLTNPSHAYTKALMAAVPTLDDPLRVAPEPRPAILEVRDLRTDLGGRGGLLNRHVPFIAVDGVSISVAPGETLGLVGESGCGKSTLSRTIVGIYRPSSGSIAVAGRDVSAMTDEDRRNVSRTVQYVFQDPLSSLNPRRTVGQSLDEALSVAGIPAKERHRRSVELLDRVGLTATYLDRYPFAFSGGQRQRVGIARALAADPKVLILDEPVSALDVSIQAQILDLLQRLQESLGLGYLFISHDLSVVRNISHRVAVMNKGKIVEQGRVDEIFTSPQHPYTRSLLASTMSVSSEALRERI